MKRILEVYIQDDRMALVPTNEITVANILNICCNCIEMVTEMANTDILTIINGFYSEIIKSYHGKGDFNWDEVF